MTRSFQDTERSSSNFNRPSGNFLGGGGGGSIRDCLIDRNDVPRLIGKGGGTIKQIQQEKGVQINISKDRPNAWVELTISGANDRVIDDAFHYIKNTIGSIQDKNGAAQSSHEHHAQPSFETSTRCTFAEHRSL